jgi:hypothetical protein
MKRLRKYTKVPVVNPLHRKVREQFTLQGAMR